MSEKPLPPLNVKRSHEAEPLLGKRHHYKEDEQKTFKSVALSIGFTQEELRTLGRVYFGPARPDSRKTKK